MTNEEAFDILKTGNNVFLTGGAGSGKTHLINRYIAYLRDHHVDVAVTASTGIAATHMGGVTIHAWAGIGVRHTLSDYDLESLEAKKYLWSRFENVKVLIIDEVSMLHHFRLDMVDRIIRHFKRNEKPFGGIQVVLVGDFFQLPPVSRAGEPRALFAFKSEAWDAGDFTVCYLSGNYRQKDDAFLDILHAIRTNRAGDTEKKHLSSRYKAASVSGREPTKLYTHNADVDEVNKGELEKISGILVEYDMSYSGKAQFVELLMKGCLAPETLCLKQGARVMCVKNNFEAGYVNGTLGTVLSCAPYEDPVIRTVEGKEIRIQKTSWQVVDDDGKVKAEITQYPLRLAWAITIHKSQGMSLDAVEVDLSKSFERGMGYVALSRVRTLEGLSLLGLNDQALRVDDDVLSFDEELRIRSECTAKALREVPRASLQKQQAAFISYVSGEPQKKHKKKQNTYDITRDFLVAQTPLETIARERKMTVETILSHAEKIIENENSVPVEYLLSYMSPRKIKDITDAVLRVQALSPEKEKTVLLSPIKEMLGSRATFQDIRLVRLVMKKEGLI